MAQPIVMLMIMAWLLAGVLSTLLGASGFVEALVWLARSGGVSGGAYVAAAFVVCCLVSTSTGTSFGTIMIGGPLLYPAGAAIGADPAMLDRRILGGATFGDSISPISDTTIASCRHAARRHRRHGARAPEVRAAGGRGWRDWPI